MSIGFAHIAACWRVLHGCLGYYQLFQSAVGMFLRHKAVVHGVAVLSVNEAYTTTTVSWTGELPDDVGSTSVIVGRDGERMDRDYNGGARGVYLRALGDTLAQRAWLSACAASVDNSRLCGIVRAVA